MSDGSSAMRLDAKVVMAGACIHVQFFRLVSNIVVAVRWRLASMTTISLNVGGSITAVGSGLTGIPAATALTGAVGIANGGTGQIAKAAGFDALSPTTTTGDMIYLTGGSNVRLALGSNGTILTSNGTAPTYATLSTSAALTGNGVSTQLDLANTAVTAGTYGAPSVTFDAKGRATAASNILTTTGDLLTYASGAATRLAVGGDGKYLTANSGATSGNMWTTPMISANNAGISVAVATNALTVTMTQSDGSSAPSASAPVFLAFRSATATTGGINVVAVTSSVTVTIPSGATMGTFNNDTPWIYVYAMNNAGTVVLAVSQYAFDLGMLTSSSAISGGSSAYALYSTAAQTSLPIQYVGKFQAQQATAGTWASAPTVVLSPLTYAFGNNIGVTRLRTLTFINTALTVANSGNTPIVSGTLSGNYANYIPPEWNGNNSYIAQVAGTYAVEMLLTMNPTLQNGNMSLILEKFDQRAGSFVIATNVIATNTAQGIYRVPLSAISVLNPGDFFFLLASQTSIQTSFTVFVSIALIAA